MIFIIVMSFITATVSIFRENKDQIWFVVFAIWLLLFGFVVDHRLEVQKNADIERVKTNAVQYRLRTR